MKTQKEKVCTNCGCPDPQKRYDHYWCKYCHNEMKQTLSCSDCKYDKAETYHDKMWCRDCRQKDRFEEKQS